MLPAVLPALLPLTLAPRGFCRSADVLQLGEQVTPRQVVNVLGRWRTHGDWDSVGTAKKLDDFVSGDFYEEDAPTFATDLTRVDGPARTPTRREFCLRQGLVKFGERARVPLGPYPLARGRALSPPCLLPLTPASLLLSPARRIRTLSLASTLPLAPTLSRSL